MNCPCGSLKNYTDCCEPFITGKSVAPTPEALMRSRYSAYVKVATGHLRETLAP
jgi:SEC-C motif domain protein